MLLPNEGLLSSLQRKPEPKERNDGEGGSGENDQDTMTPPSHRGAPANARGLQFPSLLNERIK